MEFSTWYQNERKMVSENNIDSFILKVAMKLKEMEEKKEIKEEE
jgi:hypothetical protein